jgi:hypothetical protein
MNDVILRCYRKKDGERRANYDVYYLFEMAPWGDCCSSKFDIEGTENVSLSVTCEYHLGSRNYGLWVREEGNLKFSVQGVKSTERNDDPTICYTAQSGEIYTFLIFFKSQLIENY